MITATFNNGVKVRAIILDAPVGESKDVWGIAECTRCSWRTGLCSSTGDVEGLAKELETFAQTHACDAPDFSFDPTKERLLRALHRESKKRRYGGA